MNVYKKFITFEGIDFSGKTTQIQFLLSKLKEYGVEALLVREPGGTIISEKIREILLCSQHEEMVSITEIFLYEAARSQLVHQTILPALGEGKFVIADRFYDSTTAYQGFGRQLNLEVVNILNSFATSNLKPYRTFFIDISPEEAEHRRIQQNYRQDRLERSGLEFYKKIRNGFMVLCSQEPKRFIRIDGEREQAIIFEEIWTIVKSMWDIQD
jgi:dTMP kinase